MRLLILLLLASSSLLLAEDLNTYHRRTATSCMLCRVTYNSCMQKVDKSTYGKLSTSDDEIECENEYAGCFLHHRCYAKGC